MRARRICERVLKADGIDDSYCVQVLRLIATGYGNFFMATGMVMMRSSIFKCRDDLLDRMARELLQAGIDEPLEDYFTRLATRVNLFEDAEE